MPRLTARPLAVRFDAAGLCLLRSRHARGFRMEPVSHPFAKLALALSGAGRLMAGRRAIPLVAGDGVWVPPGVEHHLEDEAGSPMALRILCFHGDAFPEARRLGKGSSVALAGREMAAIRRRVRELGNATRNRAGQIRCRVLAYQLLEEVERCLSGSSSAADPVGALDRVRRYAADMRQHPYREENLDEAARRAGLSRRRFSSLFREATGHTWLDQQRGARVDYALGLIRSTRMNLAAIAFESGFQDLSTFHRAFRDTLGKAPSAFRRSRA